jgi:cytochrome c oxidase subunit 3
MTHPAHQSPKGHPFHLVEPSPWPLLSAFAAGFLAVGAVMWMHYGTYGWLIAGFVAVMLTAIGWWRDVLREAVVEKQHTPTVVMGLKYGMILFIASEVAFFAAFFWAYFNASLFPVNGMWPPKGIEVLNPFEIPFLNTLILLLSGTTVTWAHHALLENKHKDCALALAVTVGLASGFLGLQALEYAHASFKLSDGIYPSTFYLATGFHGIHVLVGTIFLAVCWWRCRRGEFTPKRHFAFEAAAWYWHFVDVVWLFLFVSIYWAGSL